MININTEIDPGYGYEYGTDAAVMLDADTFVDNEELAIAIVEKFKVCIDSPERFDFTVAAAHLYERKGQKSFDELGGERNTSYASSSDDIVLQVSLRLDSRDAGELINTAEYIRGEERREALEARREELAKQKAALAAQQAAIDAELEKLS